MMLTCKYFKPCIIIRPDHASPKQTGPDLISPYYTKPDHITPYHTIQIQKKDPGITLSDYTTSGQARPNTAE